MLGEICYWILNMSIIASFMGLIILLIRRIKFIPHRVTVFLWLIPFIRMTVPFGINSPYSLMSLISKFTTRTVTVFQPADDLAFSFTNSVMADRKEFWSRIILHQSHSPILHGCYKSKDR